MGQPPPPQPGLVRSPSQPLPPLRKLPPLLLLLLGCCSVRPAAAAAAPDVLRPISVCRTSDGSLFPEAGNQDGIKTKVPNVAHRCEEKYRRFFENHTACLNPSTSATHTGVHEYSKERIIKLHNNYRSRVGEGAWSRQPTASNMQQMYWDDELAGIAQGWASQCLFHHEDPAGRYIPGSYSVGQNLAKGHASWEAAIHHWHSEVVELDFGVGKRSPKSTVGHYTQLVWAESSRLGCGFAKCNTTLTPFYVCNYGPTGNYVSKKYTPYLAGKKGSSCPSTFKDGLCDCGGKICKNNGLLNVTSCQCNCARLDWIGGEDCSLDCASATDSQLCSTKGGHLSGDDCRRLDGVASELCPIMCGLCAAAKRIERIGENCSAGNEGKAEVTTFRHQSEKESRLKAKLKQLFGLDEAPEADRPMGTADGGNPESQSPTEPTKWAAVAEAGELARSAGALAATESDQKEAKEAAKLRWLKLRLGLESDDNGRAPPPPAAAHSSANSQRRLAEQRQPLIVSTTASIDKAAVSATTATSATAAALKPGKTATGRKDLWDRLVLDRLAQMASGGKPGASAARSRRSAPTAAYP